MKLDRLVRGFADNFSWITCSITAKWWLVTFGQLNTKLVSSVIELRQHFSMANITINKISLTLIKPDEISDLNLTVNS
jgi:hypothetical protein